MSVRSVCYGLALSCILSPALAETISEALSDFGLIGTWSVDCGRDITTPCSRGGCAIRHIFEAPPLGSPTKSILTGPSEFGTQPTKTTVPIEAAARITSDKIRISYTRAGGIDRADNQPWMPHAGDKWETIYEKLGEKLRTVNDQRSDGKIVMIKEGVFYLPKKHGGEDPTSWEATGQQVPILERCQN